MLSRKKNININQHHVWKHEVREPCTRCLSCQRSSGYSKNAFQFIPVPSVGQGGTTGLRQYSLIFRTLHPAFPLTYLPFRNSKVDRTLLFSLCLSRLLRKFQIPSFLLSPPYFTVHQDLLQAMNLVELFYTELINQKYNFSFLKEKNI